MTPKQEKMLQNISEKHFQNKLVYNKSMSNKTAGSFIKEILKRIK